MSFWGFYKTSQKTSTSFPSNVQQGVFRIYNWCDKQICNTKKLKLLIEKSSSGQNNVLFIRFFEVKRPLGPALNAVDTEGW